MAARTTATGRLVRTAGAAALVAAVVAVGADARETASPHASVEPRRCVWSAYGGAAGRSFTPPCAPPRGAGLARPRGVSFRPTRAAVTAAPVLDGETAFVGDWGGRVHAVDLRSGSVRWTFAAGARVVASGALAGLGRERLLVVAAGRTLHALRARDGASVWHRGLGASTAIDSAPAVARGLVLVGSSAGVWALRVRDGVAVWRFRGLVRTSPTVDVARGAVYVGTRDAIVALDLDTGRIRWSVRPQAARVALGFTGKATLLRGRGGAPLVGVGSADGCYYAVDARSGRVVWTRRVADVGPRGGAAGGLLVPAARHGQRLYLTSAAGRGPYLTALDAATGRVAWRSADAGPSFAPPVVLGSVVVTTEAGGILRGIDRRTGRTLWLTRTRRPLTGGIAVAGRWLAAGTGFQVDGAAASDAANGLVVYRFR
jgi:outer membrane protein assembly factor BamB